MNTAEEEEEEEAAHMMMLDADEITAGKRKLSFSFFLAIIHMADGFVSSSAAAALRCL